MNIEAIIKESDSRISLVKGVLQSISCEKIAEVGVYKGDFAKSILTDISGLEHYYMIDPWRNLEDWNKPANKTDKLFQGIYEEAMEKTNFAASKRIVLRGKTTEVVGEIPDNSLDCVYIDGDHTLKGITIDLIRLFPKVKDGGVILGDDYRASIWQHGFRYEPTMVFPFANYFAESLNLPTYALPFGQFMIEKQSTGYNFHDFTNKYGDTSVKKHFDMNILLKTMKHGMLKWIKPGKSY